MVRKNPLKMTQIVTAQNVKKFLELDIKKFSKERLYIGVKSYLEDLIKSKEIDAEKLRNPESLTYKIFETLEAEILRREAVEDKERRKNGIEMQSEYALTFDDLLFRSGIIKFRQFDITDGKLIN